MSSETKDAVLVRIHKVENSVLVLHVFGKRALSTFQELKKCTAYVRHLVIRGATQDIINSNFRLFRARLKWIHDILTILSDRTVLNHIRRKIYVPLDVFVIIYA